MSNNKAFASLTAANRFLRYFIIVFKNIFLLKFENLILNIIV